ncbi:hypothetical protein NC651_021791 [Populus alba x Populus x berolinensis]|nr:hypothetical protein NC651_021791 [Populus alba x Populus x berolinensis]
MESSLEAVNFGKSIIIPSVQEMAKESTKIPPRYERPDQDPPIISTDASPLLSSIPVIDLERVSSTLLEEFKMQVENFFKLPYEDKKKLWQKPDNHEGFGQLFVIISNGVYRSVEHRAKVNSEKERLSVATFYSSNLDSVLGPAPSLLGKHNPAIFRSVPIEKYFKDFFSQKLNGKSYLECLRIADGEDNTAVHS